MGTSKPIYLEQLELDADQKLMIRRYQQWLWGAKSPFSRQFISERNGRKTFAVEGLIDKHLTQLCRTGEPMQVSRSQYSLHLNASYWRCRLPEVTRHHLAEHLFGGEYTAYYVGPARRQSEYILACLDLDDKNHTGDAPLLAEHVRAACPLIANVYVEPSTRGWGCHLYFILHHPDHAKRQVNALLKDLADFLTDITSTYGCLSNIDAIKGTYPLVREEMDDDLRQTGRTVCESQGVLAKLPRPEDADRLEALINCPVVPFEQLYSFLADYEIISAEMTSAADQSASWDSTALQYPHLSDQVFNRTNDPTSSLASSSSTGTNGSSQSFSAQENKDRQTSPNPLLSSSPAPGYTLRSPMAGETGNIGQMIASGDGAVRKVGVLFWLQQQLRRYPTFQEYEHAYYLLKANRNPQRTREQRRTALRRTHERFEDAFDLLKCGHAFRKADYQFLSFSQDEIGHLRARKRSCPVELVQVIVYLAEKPRINRDPLRNHTVGIRLVDAVTTLLAAGGAISKPYTQDKQISAARRVAEHFGWIQQIDEHFVGSAKVGGASRKYIVGKNHPRYEQFMALHSMSVEASGESVNRLKDMYYERKKAKKEVADWVAAAPSDAQPI